MDYRERWELKEYLLEQRLGRRVTLFRIVLLGIALSYLLCFWYLQVVSGEEYARLAEENRLRKVAVMPTRGVIYDRAGKVIASTRPSLDLFLLREDLTNRDAQLRGLEEVLGLKPGELDARLADVRGRPGFEPLALKENVELDELARIEVRRERFRSVDVRRTPRRTYPEGSAVAHVVGHVGEVSERELASASRSGRLLRGDIVGKSGIERAYDDLLRGHRGWEFVTVNSLGRRLGDPRRGRDPRNGKDLHLTIDLDLQQTLVEALGDEVGAGVFLDPRTGEVLALASSPSYDPNLFAAGITPEAWNAILHDEERPLHDRTIASFYAPGSTFKIVMAAAGLESGVVDPSRRVYCNGSAKHYNRVFRCWKRGGHGWVNLHKALVHSCNVYFYQLGKELGIERIHEYGERFGLGRPTGIDLPGEAAGVLPSDAWKRREQGTPWYPGETISVAIGQGLLAVTPIQLATMVSAIATDGRLPRPHLRRETEVESSPVGISADTLGRIRAALKEAVEDGTGRRAALKGIAVAGKTGTSQVLKKSAGIDADKLPKDERDHAWFVGYAPADDPTIAFAVVVEHGGHGGTSAAPVVRRVLEVFFGDEKSGATADETLRASGGGVSEEYRVWAPTSR